MLANKRQIDDKLWELQKVCNRYKEKDYLADYVLLAVYKHIKTGKATRKFKYNFVNYPDEKLLELVKTCLNGDRSNDGIIKAVNWIIAV